LGPLAFSVNVVPAWAARLALKLWKLKEPLAYCPTP
jgi:hypothetical protein